MTPTSALAPLSLQFTQTSNAEDYDTLIPSFVGLGLSMHATPADLGALADRAEAGVSALQLLFDAEAVGAVELPQRLADQLRLLLARATGSEGGVEFTSPPQLALLS